MGDGFIALVRLATSVLCLVHWFNLEAALAVSLTLDGWIVSLFEPLFGISYMITEHSAHQG